MFGLDVFSKVFGVIGSLTSGVFTYINKKQDVDLEKYKVNGQVDIEQIRAFTLVAQARAADTVDRWGRRLLIYPACIYDALVFYDSAFRSLIPTWTWRVLELPPDFKYINLAVVAYLTVQVMRRRV